MVTATIAQATSDIDDAQLACMVVGHEWPSRKLRPGRRIPRGMSAARQVDGSHLVKEECSGCGKIRYSLWENGVMGRTVRRWYQDPENWKVTKAESGITKGDLIADFYGRCEGTLFGVSDATAGIASAVFQAPGAPS